jgi:hypothetical protein
LNRASPACIPYINETQFGIAEQYSLLILPDRTQQGRQHFGPLLAHSFLIVILDLVTVHGLGHVTPDMTMPIIIRRGPIAHFIRSVERGCF